jgi:hypothetical protein
VLVRPFQRRARGVSLQVEPLEASRGGKVRVSVAIQSSDDAQLQVGLLCRQFTDVKHEYHDQHGSHTQRVIERSDVVADWRDVPAGTAAQSYEFTIPADGPFSYEGAAVSWAYCISARRPKHHAIDPHDDVWIWVKP